LNNEHCPFCKSKINEGATVCVGCGAFYSAAMPSWKAWGTFGAVMWIAGFLAPPKSGFFILEWGGAILFLFAIANSKRKWWRKT
jgi:hypothetical protein